MFMRVIDGSELENSYGPSRENMKLFPKPNEINKSFQDIDEVNYAITNFSYFEDL
jgi:hypothetical protein